jgi:hypothetical protein
MTNRTHTPAASPVRVQRAGRSIALGLAVCTLLVYYQVQGFDFVNLDDYDYVLNNPNVRYGISLEGIVRAFTQPYAFNWHPLTWISHMVDAELFGLNPGAHHLSSLLFHLANTLLLFHLLRRLTHALWRSALVAALFAFHPLHVESVAWISERKDVLSTLFFLLAILAYLRYTERPDRKRYLLTLLVFALGLMAKPMVVTLPFVLLLLDLWPLRRRDRSPAGLGMEKIPFLLLSAASSVLTLAIHLGGGSVVSASPLGVRLINALFSYVLYLLRTFWPAHLSCYYPHPEEALGIWHLGGSILLLGMIAAAAIATFRKAPFLLVGWLWFLGTLVPVIGLVQTGGQGSADRYTYIPLIGLFLAVSWGGSALFDRIKAGVVWRSIIAGAALFALALVSWIQIGYWKDSFTLFERELAVSDRKQYAHFHLGNAYSYHRQPGRAIFHYAEAVRLDPRYGDARYNLAATLTEVGDLTEAKNHYRLLLQQEPFHLKALNNLGILLLSEGKEDEALIYLKRALEVNPADGMVRKNIEALQKDMKRE